MLKVELDEAIVNAMLEKAINERVDELAKQKYFLSFNELATYLNISKPTITDRLLENGCPYYKVGSRYLFKRDEIDSFLDDMTSRMSATDNDILFFKHLKKG